MRRPTRVLAVVGIASVAILLIAGTARSPRQVSSASAAGGGRPDEVVFVPNGVVAFAAESMDAVLAREAVSPTPAGFQSAPARMLPDFAQQKPPTIDASGVAGGGGSALLTETQGVSWDGPAICNCEPPDPIIAVGTLHVLTGINDQIRANTKTGSQVWSTSWESFFASVRPSGASFTSDSKLFFDPVAQRFFAAVLFLNSTETRSWWMVAVSQTDQIGSSTVWYKWAFDPGVADPGLFADYPGFGFDGDAIYITSNMFSSFFEHVDIAVVPKAQLLTGTASPTFHQINSVTQSNGSLAFTIQPARMYGTGAALLASSTGGSGSQIYLYRVVNALGSPSLTKTAVSVSSYSTPPDAAQPGGAAIATNDSRMLSVAWQNDRLWCTHTVSASARAGARWYSFNTTNWPTTTLANSGTVIDGSNYYYYPSIAVDQFDNVAIGCTRSSSTEFASTYHMSRAATDGQGVMSTPFRDHLGTGSYAGTRWGDFSGTCIDPVDGTTFWMLQEYARGSSWGTWVKSFWLASGDTTPPQPDPMTFSAPPSAAGPTGIAMTATLAVDANSPPVQYFFHFVSGGPGGADSGWQSGQSYTNNGLTSNTSYTYQVKARDSAVPPNETQYSASASIFTLANVPAAPTLGNATVNSLALTIDPTGNPGATEIAIQCTTTTDPAWFNNYVSATGQPAGVPTWQAASTWATLTLPGLMPSTQYCFAAKARNGNQVQTAFSTPGCGQTLGAPTRGDMNCDGLIDFNDIGPFVLALSNPAAYAQQFPNCNIMNGDVNGDGLVDFNDINPFVALLAH